MDATTIILLIALAGVAFALWNMLIIWEIRNMSAAFDRLTQEVEEQTSVVQSAITLLQTLAQEIRDNAGNEEATNALADRLDAQTNALAQAVDANQTPQPEQPEV